MNGVERETQRRAMRRAKQQWDEYKSDTNYKDSVVQLLYVQAKYMDEILRKLEEAGK